MWVDMQEGELKTRNRVKLFRKYSLNNNVLGFVIVFYLTIFCEFAYSKHIKRHSKHIDRSNHEGNLISDLNLDTYSSKIHFKESSDIHSNNMKDIPIDHMTNSEFLENSLSNIESENVHGSGMKSSFVEYLTNPNPTRNNLSQIQSKDDRIGEMRNYLTNPDNSENSSLNIQLDTLNSKFSDILSSRFPRKISEGNDLQTQVLKESIMKSIYKILESNPSQEEIPWESIFGQVSDEFLLKENKFGHTSGEQNDESLQIDFGEDTNGTNLIEDDYKDSADESYEEILTEDDYKDSKEEIYGETLTDDDYKDSEDESYEDILTEDNHKDSKEENYGETLMDDDYEDFEEESYEDILTEDSHKDSKEENYGETLMEDDYKDYEEDSFESISIQDNHKDSKQETNELTSIQPVDETDSSVDKRQYIQEDEKGDNGKCKKLHIPNGIITWTYSGMGYIECENGYTSTSGKKETNFMCSERNWIFDLMALGENVQCIPDKPCTDEHLPELENGYVRKIGIGSSGVEGVCNHGYLLYSKESSSRFICQKNSWTFPDIAKDGCHPIALVDSTIYDNSIMGGNLPDIEDEEIGLTDIQNLSNSKYKVNRIVSEPLPKTENEFDYLKSSNNDLILPNTTLVDANENNEIMNKLKEMNKSMKKLPSTGKRSVESIPIGNQSSTLDSYGIDDYYEDYLMDLQDQGHDIEGEDVSFNIIGLNSRNDEILLKSNKSVDLITNQSTTVDSLKNVDNATENITSMPGDLFSIGGELITTELNQINSTFIFISSTSNQAVDMMTNPSTMASSFEIMNSFTENTTYISDFEIDKEKLTTELSTVESFTSSLPTVNTRTNLSTTNDPPIINDKSTEGLRSLLANTAGIGEDITTEIVIDILKDTSIARKRSVELSTVESFTNSLPTPTVNTLTNQSTTNDPPKINDKSTEGLRSLLDNTAGIGEDITTEIVLDILKDTSITSKRSVGKSAENVTIAPVDGPHEVAVDKSVDNETSTTEISPSGLDNDVSNDCIGPYPTVGQARVNIIDDEATMTCLPGYAFPNGYREVPLDCENGDWVLPSNFIDDNTTNCIKAIDCPDPCQNGGHCLPNGTCWCKVGYQGPSCQTMNCGPLPLVIYNAALTVPSSQGSPVATCHRGYTFDGGDTKLEFHCINGTWDIPEPYKNSTEATCLAVCDPPCEHGGKCIEPNHCRCPEEYTGKHCEVIKCSSPLPFVKNSDIEYDPAISIARCIEGYQFKRGNTMLNIECVDGDWKADCCDDEINPKLECIPICKEECQNGGTCVAPDSCACPTPFDGPTCTDYRDNTCGSSPPLVKKATMNYTITLGDAECITGYALPTGETSVKFVCNYGEWKFPSTALKNLECQPKCSGGCQNGGKCIDANVCECGKPYTGKLCQTVARDICSNPPAPIPNSNMHISPLNIIVNCQAGYAFPSGNTQTELLCIKNNWVTADHKDPTAHLTASEDSTNPLACFPQCDPPCLNKGICVGVNKCQCHSPYTGTYCQDMMEQFCWEEPPDFDNAYVHYNSSRATVICKDGYILDSLEKELTLICLKGEWAIRNDSGTKVMPHEHSTCNPTCVPPCDNGGNCTAPNTCTCKSDFFGPICQERRCPSVPTAILYSYVSFGLDGTAMLSCFTGYIMNTGAQQIMLECSNATWQTIETTPRTVDELECKPFCTQHCLNGGSCIAPNFCNCTEKYAGNYCQAERCAADPVANNKAITTLSKDLLSADISCKKGYRLSSGHKNLDFACRKGKWRNNESFYIKGGIDCEPVCQKGCSNGGQCIAPNTCQCPRGFLGFTCNRRYARTIDGLPCTFPFMHNGTWYQSCTSVDSPHPWCATQINNQGHVIKWGYCVADLGDVKLVVTKKRKVCVFPFIYQEEQYLGCTSSRDRPKPWCATKVDSEDMTMEWDECDLDWGVSVAILTVKGSRCKFSFLHDGKEYNKCVDDHNDEELYPWCATKVSPSGTPLKTDICKLDWGVIRVITTKKYQVCQFPFTWRNQSVYSCLPSASPKNGPWCATKVDQKNKMLEWDECSDEKAGQFLPPSDIEPPSPTGPHLIDITTENGYKCVVPFLYRGMRQLGCVHEGFNLPWCATSVDTDLNVVTKDTCPMNWDLPEAGKHMGQFSKLVQQRIKEKILTVDGVPCIFPFRYKDIMYMECIQLDATQPFCATKVGRDLEVTKAGVCPSDWDSKLNPIHRLPGLLNEPLCIFPFYHENRKHTQCIALRGRSVCASKVDDTDKALEFVDCPKDKDKRKPIPTENGDNCILPFIYEDVTHFRCIIQGSSKPFCATRVDRDRHTKNVGYCLDNTREPVEVTTESEKECQLPFIYNGITTFGCIITEESKGRPICATDVAPDLWLQEYDYCPDDWEFEKDEHFMLNGSTIQGETEDGKFDTEVLETENGHRCVLPFRFENRVYDKCTRRKAKKPWCATQVDEGLLHTKWDYCKRKSHGHNEKPMRMKAPKDLAECDDPPEIHSEEKTEQNAPITTINNMSCVFPFLWGGREYNTCVKDRKGTKPWCATSIDANGFVKTSDTCQLPGSTYATSRHNNHRLENPLDHDHGKCRHTESAEEIIYNEPPQNLRPDALDTLF